MTVGDAMADLVERGPRHWTIEVTNLTLLAGGASLGLALTGRA